MFARWVGMFVVAVGLSACSSSGTAPFDGSSLHQGESTTQISATLAQPTLLYFYEPTLNGAFLDLCQRKGVGCGRPTADAFCQNQGYARARSFIESYRGRRGPTRTMVSQRTCESRCSSFDEIVCEERIERTFVNPTLRDHPLDNCLSFGRGCGMPAASAYCQSQGFQRAVEFGVYRDGVRQRTELQQGRVTSCEGDNCGAFRYIRCTPLAKAG